MKLNALLPAFLLCGMTEGYTITFYRGSRCRGARLSTRRPVGNIFHNVLIVDNQTTSAIVQRESGDGSNTGEWQPDCSQNQSINNRDP
jgi:hypothetical protein